MTVTVELAGDTMLGRGVARTLATTPPATLVAPEVRALLDQADLARDLLANLLANDPEA